MDGVLFGRHGDDRPALGDKARLIVISHGEDDMDGVVGGSTASRRWKRGGEREAGCTADILTEFDFECGFSLGTWKGMIGVRLKWGGGGDEWGI